MNIETPRGTCTQSDIDIQSPWVKVQVESCDLVWLVGFCKRRKQVELKENVTLGGPTVWSPCFQSTRQKCCCSVGLISQWFSQYNNLDHLVWTWWLLSMIYFSSKCLLDRYFGIWKGILKSNRFSNRVFHVSSDNMQLNHTDWFITFNCANRLTFDDDSAVQSLSVCTIIGYTSISVPQCP